MGEGQKSVPGSHYELTTSQKLQSGLYTPCHLSAF